MYREWQNSYMVIAANILSLVPTVATNYILENYMTRLIINNIIFSMTFFALIMIIRRLYHIRFVFIICPSIIFGLLSIAFSFAAIFLASDHIIIANIVAYPVIAIGYYPPGVDLWFPAGIAVWALSFLVLVSLSSWLAIAVAEKTVP
jgi:hypothetical protein